MHTEAIRKYMTERMFTYAINKWDTCDEHYWLEKYDKDGNYIESRILYNIEKLWDKLEGQLE